jgi:hypothetical protein
MKTDLLPTLNPFSQIFSNLPIKSNTRPNNTAVSNGGKLPQGAKIIGNYLLGNRLETQARTSGKAPSERCIWPCTSRQVKKLP